MNNVQEAMELVMPLSSASLWADTRSPTRKVCGVCVRLRLSRWISCVEHRASSVTSMASAQGMTVTALPYFVQVTRLPEMISEEIIGRIAS